MMIVAVCVLLVLCSVTVALFLGIVHQQKELLDCVMVCITDLKIVGF